MIDEELNLDDCDADHQTVKQSMCGQRWDYPFYEHPCYIGNVEF